MRSRILVPVALIATLTACASDDPHRRAKLGAAIGAVAGAVIGHQIDDDTGKIMGGAVGAIAGAVVGDYMDDQQQDFEDKLAEEQRQNQLEIERINNTLKIDINNEVSFDVDSSALKPAFSPTLTKVSELLAEYDRTVIHIVGHTDATGNDAYNMTLSNRRAASVREFLTARGIDGDRVFTEGRGESEPRATNDTPAGRQLNRRVE